MTIAESVVTDIQIAPNIFNEAYLPHLENETRMQIFYGGAGSGKSVFLAQRAIVDVLKGSRNYLVCRAVGRYIRKSVFNELEQVIANWKLESLFDTLKQEMTITCNNGYQIMFTGLDDAEKLKSIRPKKGVITDVWIEEATEVNQASMKLLNKRLRGRDAYSAEVPVKKRMTLSFNPILQSHWIYREFFSGIEWADEDTIYAGDSLFILKTWYIHNDFLTEEDVDDLESEEDSYYYDVYTLGNWGVLGNVIFKNWEVRDLSDMQDQFDKRRNGLDFGFSNDPAAIVKTHYNKKRKTIYIFDEFYERGLTNDLLAVEAINLVGNDYVVCDSAEPKSIQELRDHGVSAMPAKKGKDSVLFGIQWLQQQKIVIDIRCLQAKNEFQQYKWKEDKDGNALRKPVEINDHLLDSLRYAYEEDMQKTTAKITTKISVDNYAMRPAKKKRKAPGYRS